MWPLVAALLLGSFHGGLAQLLFKKISSVKASRCNSVVLIPCYVSNTEASDISQLFLKWKFGQELIFVFDGYARKSTLTPMFPSAQISPSEFLKGNASLALAKNEAKEGNYTCKVTELSREGKHTVELKYSDDSWFPLSEFVPIIIFPFLTILLFWAQFGILTPDYTSNQSKLLRSKTQMTADADKDVEKEEHFSIVGGAVQPLWKSVLQFLRKLDMVLPEDPVIPLWAHILEMFQHTNKDTCSNMFIAALSIIAKRLQKYKSNLVNRKMIILSASGLLITIVVIVGAILYTPGSYSKRKGIGLVFLISPSVIPVFLQYHKFKPAIGRTLQAMILLTILQALGVVLTMSGLYLTTSECIPKYGPLLISGLVIVALVELFGLIYMKWLGILYATISSQEQYVRCSKHR